MGSLSDYAENALLNHLTTNAAYSPSATIYLALCTADPTDAGTGASMNEVANSGAYARKAITFGAASSRRVTQNATVTYDQASGSWGTISHWAIVDSATHGAGNMLAHGAFSVSKSVVSGNTPSVASSEVYVEITASTGLSTYFANGFLDRMFRNQAFTVSATYAALATSAPSDGAAGTEVSGNNYARKQISANGGSAPAWGTVSAGSVSNGAAVTFATPSGSWGTVTHMMIMDASTSGNMLAYGDVTDNAVAANDTVQFATSALTITQA